MAVAAALRKNALRSQTRAPPPAPSAPSVGPARRPPPDERSLYVTNWDEKKKVVMCYDVAADGALSGGRVFFDMTRATGEEALDGVKVDAAGNLFVSGPGGLWIIAPDGSHLGTLKLPELAANLAWGDADGRSLYLTARTGLYRLRTATGRPQTTTGATSVR